VRPGAGESVDLLGRWAAGPHAGQRNARGRPVSLQLGRNGRPWRDAEVGRLLRPARCGEADQDACGGAGALIPARSQVFSIRPPSGVAVLFHGRLESRVFTTTELRNSRSRCNRFVPQLSCESKIAPPIIVLSLPKVMATP